MWDYIGTRTLNCGVYPLAAQRTALGWFTLQPARGSSTESIANVKEAQELMRRSDQGLTMDACARVRKGGSHGLAERHGTGRSGTPGARAIRVQRETRAHKSRFLKDLLVEDAGIEPATSRLPALRSPS